MGKPRPDRQAQTGRGPGGLLGLLILVLAAGATGFLALQAIAAAPAPLGVPLPPSRQHFLYEGVAAGDASFVEQRGPEEWLEYMAVQPDGLPPLRFHYQNERAGFGIGYYHGSSNMTFPPEDFDKDNVDSQALFQVELPLTAVKVSMPYRRENERLTEYVARARHDLEQLGAQFHAQREPLDVAGYHFEHYEYTREQDGAPVDHLVYLGPLGVRVLIFDFFVRPGQSTAARPYVEKIMHSFSSSNLTLKGMEMEALLVAGPPVGDLPSGDEALAEHEQEHAPGAEHADEEVHGQLGD